jgi:PadR family transcriptional regulator PadR
MLASPIEMPNGTLDLLVLRVLLMGPQHGWAVCQRIQQVSDNAIQLQQGTVYPALQRLERQGWIKSRWAATENNRRARYYELTSAGRKQLETETANWRRLTATINQILETA